MNVTKKTAGVTAKERVIVAVCDVFDIRKTKEWYASRGYQPTGNWQYANRQKTIVRVEFALPATLTFSIHDLLDDLLTLLVSGRYSRNDTLNVLSVFEAQEGGAR